VSRCLPRAVEMVGRDGPMVTRVVDGHGIFRGLEGRRE
jgi:hypothetical protein